VPFVEPKCLLQYFILICVQKDATLRSLFCMETALHVEQFPYKINCVTLHLVGHILDYSYDGRTNER